MKEKNEFEKHQTAKKYYDAGQALALRGRYEEAIECYNKSQELEPNNLDMLKAKMISAFQLGRLEEAIEVFDNAMDIYKSDVEGDTYGWTKYIIRQMQLIREDKAIRYNNDGCSLSSSRQYEEALEEHNKAIRLDPYNVYFLKEKANVLVKLQRLEEAIEVLNEVIEIEPNDAGYYNQAICLLYLGRYEEVINNLNKAIELNHNAASSYYNKGQCLYRLKRLEEAIEAYDNAISLRPRDAKAYNNKGKCLYELGRLEESRIALEKAVKLRPYYGIAKHNRNILNRKLGQHIEQE